MKLNLKGKTIDVNNDVEITIEEIAELLARNYKELSLDPEDFFEFFSMLSDKIRRQLMLSNHATEETP